MHTEARLVGTPRSVRGTRASRKLRAQGAVPGNLYGHHEAPQMLTANSTELTAIVRAGVRVIDLDLNGATSKVILREVQWDPFGQAIQHFDLVRVDADEKIIVDVPLELKGTSPGTLSGGVLEFVHRTIKLECLAVQVPDSVPVKIQELQLGDAIHVRDVELPATVRVLDDPETVIVRVVAASAAPIVTEGLEVPTQPELIGRKPAAEEEEAT